MPLRAGSVTCFSGCGSSQAAPSTKVACCVATDSVLLAAACALDADWDGGMILVSHDFRLISQVRTAGVPSLCFANRRVALHLRLICSGCDSLG